MRLEAHPAYVEPCASASQPRSGNIPCPYTTLFRSDANTVGTYTVTYTVKDAANNPQTATRTVNVIDTTAPVMTERKSDWLKSSHANTSYEPGWTESDTCSGNLTGAIQITGVVDANT